ncbi:hypothetical protein AL504_31855 [Achromobacter xylosoxidans]|uniref:Uncharacterized protein n=1 Tax=Alcaligenes xylosoxydans xylosoxydans TaxID=85698 RepID=A0A2L0PU63_ALCXX|nr:hypothetical protein AL504_31855 [Achromobacter xylosoxidans]
MRGGDGGGGGGQGGAGAEAGGQGGEQAGQGDRHEGFQGGWGKRVGPALTRGREGWLAACRRTAARRLRR